MITRQNHKLGENKALVGESIWCLLVKSFWTVDRKSGTVINFCHILLMDPISDINEAVNTMDSIKENIMKAIHRFIFLHATTIRVHNYLWKCNKEISQFTCHFFKSFFTDWLPSSQMLFQVVTMPITLEMGFLKIKLSATNNLFLILSVTPMLPAAHPYISLSLYKCPIRLAKCKWISICLSYHDKWYLITI